MIPCCLPFTNPKIIGRLEEANMDSIPLGNSTGADIVCVASSRELREGYICMSEEELASVRGNNVPGMNGLADCSIRD